MSTLSQEEIDALVSQLAAADPAAQRKLEGRKIKSVDFRFAKHQEKFSNNQLLTLRMLHDNFTRLLNNALSVYLRARVEATIVSIEQISYGDFVASIGLPSILGIVSMEPLPGSAIVQVDLNLIFSVIDRLLGGPGWYPQKIRELTEIEKTLVQRFLARMLNSYRESWSYMRTLSLKIEALDTDPQFMPRIIPLDQTVAFVSCQLKVGDISGPMNFCLPYIVLQSIGPQLSEFAWSPSVAQPRGTTEADLARLARNVERAEVEVRVELGKTAVSLADLVALQPGDVVVFEKTTSEPLVARLNERERFLVFPGANRDRIAVQVAGIIEREDD